MSIPVLHMFLFRSSKLSDDHVGDNFNQEYVPEYLLLFRESCLSVLY